MLAGDSPATALTRAPSSAVRWGWFGCWNVGRQPERRRWAEGDFVAEVSKPADEMHYGLRFVPAVEIVLPLLPVVFAVPQHLVGDDQDVMGDCQYRLGVPASDAQTPVQGCQVRSLGVARRPGSLTQIAS